MNNTLTEVSTKPLLLCESAISKAEIHISKLFSTHNPVRDVAVKGYSLPTHHKNIISASTQQASSNYDTLIGNLNQYRDIIQSNRSELHPVDEDLEGIDNADEASDDLNVM